MTLKIKDLFVKGYERVIHATNEASRLDCIIAIHNTKLGPALGGSINEKSRSLLKCRAIVGAANNQLDNNKTDEWLFKNNIVYSPDYLVNSGGVIAIACEINNEENRLNNRIHNIIPRLELVLNESKKNKLPTNLVANRISLERINNQLKVEN